jgi:hypothetical protein
MAIQKKQFPTTILIIGIVVVAAIGFLLVSKSLLKTVNPREAFKQAEQKSAQKASVYVPAGYTVEKQAEKQVIKGIEVYVTQMENKTNLVTIYQRPSSDFSCTYNTLKVGDHEVCLRETTNQNGKFENYMWDTGIARYELGTRAKQLSQTEMAKIIGSLE